MRGFTPDGKAVLFSSPRAVFTNRYTQLFTVPLDGGMPTQLPIPNGDEGGYSPDGSHIAYTPLGAAPSSGSTTAAAPARIWLYRHRGPRRRADPAAGGARCNDIDPQWIGDTVYFRSDRNGEFNLFAYDTRDEARQAAHAARDFPVLDASAGGGKIVYEQAGYLHLFDPADRAAARLKIGVPADLRETRPRFVKGAKYIRNARCRRPARGRCSSSAARSSRCRPRRATRAT